ncbi:MAG: helix-turn-helix domain-containing protein [Myxococcota bacterium]
MIRPIRNDEDLERAFAQIDELWDSAPGTDAWDELDVLITLVDAYEAEHHALPPGDPIELIRCKLRELDWSQNELGRRLGWSSGRVSEILSEKRSLTLPMVRQLSSVLAIPPGLLVGAQEGVPAMDEGWFQVSPLVLAKVREVASREGESVSAWIDRTLKTAVNAPNATADITGPAHPEATQDSTNRLALVYTSAQTDETPTSPWGPGNRQVAA